MENFEANITNTDFTDKIKLEFSLKSERVEDFSNKLCEAFSATLKLEEIGTKLTPFKKI